jgi:signal transduction histidine kinase
MQATAIRIPQEPAAALSHDMQEELVNTVVTAESVHAALDDLGAFLLRHGAVAGIEWWTPMDESRSLRLELSAGNTKGARATVALEPVGTLVLIGERAADLVSTIGSLRPFLRLRWSEEQLAEHVSRLARKTEALDDFAALVAHDVKSSLVAALRSEDPREGLTRALELVDSILEAVRADLGGTGVAQLPDSVRQAIDDLGGPPPEIVANVTGEFPIHPDALRLILRNLLANAVAAGAERIHVSALARGDQRILVIDDDGVGLAPAEGYVTGAKLGLRLCRRLVERYGGMLELRPRAIRGTRALIVATAAAK